ncbi:MAG TPA: FAD:protein FMN transferase [Puia sp.]|uniref:FAD:protein FMN transferase n=1 Tax=Puia sp. TaxID=2045100 RepID=UPI002B57523E|nr:FAD:protein FMN transferase [Puia sp.]HVU97912.1 FAD:protein FMN transferase [Puia sp.]
MGSPFTVTLATDDSLAAARAAAAAFRLADTLNSILSDYIDSSEINRLSATSGQGRYVAVSAPLFDILRRAQEAAAMTAGGYDITIGPVVRLWRRARKTGVPPTETDIAIAMGHCGYRHLHLDTMQTSVWLDIPGMQLDVGGLGKGFVAAAALRQLQQAGFEKAMVNAGGKIVTGPPPAGQTGWIIGINAPGEKERLLSIYLSLDKTSVATSGDIYQYLEWHGKRYSHIIDPRTGIGLTRRRNVTAIAADGTTADWLATACSILSWRRSLKLLKHLPGAALLVTEMKRGRVIQKSSVTFKQYLLPDATADPFSPR